MASINKIELRNWKIIENGTFDKGVKGDVYCEGECVGTYNPLHKDGNEFLRLEKVELREQYKDYKSLFEYDGEEVGIEGLLRDLELMIQVQDFMSKVEDSVGIINGDNVKVLKLGGMRDKLDVLRFIRERVESFKIDNNYPTKVFLNDEDFDIDLRYVL